MRRSKDDAATEPGVPAVSSPADDRRCHHHSRSYNYGRRRSYDYGRDDDGPIRPATSKRTAVKSDPAPSLSLGAKRCEG